jgi:hypothetical protein
MLQIDIASAAPCVLISQPPSNHGSVRVSTLCQQPFNMLKLVTCVPVKHAIVAQTNLLTSAANCGACGTACSFSNAAASCSNGNCVLGTCNQNYGNCNGNNTDGCEVSLTRAAVAAATAAAAATVKFRNNGAPSVAAAVC